MDNREYLPLFVYGTLRRGGVNYQPYLREHSVREIAATMPGTLYLGREGWYPCLYEGNSPVTGELIWLRPDRFQDLLGKIDLLEDYDASREEESLYLRRRGIATSAEVEYVCWVYFATKREAPGVIIPSGDFFSVVPPTDQHRTSGE